MRIPFLDEAKDRGRIIAREEILDGPQGLKPELLVIA
jgi:hypothetical protein